MLLRGAASILRGEVQNDIDVWVPSEELILLIQDLSTLGATTINLELPTQIKLRLVTVPASERVPMDVFTSVCWRGLEITTVEELPKVYCEPLCIHSLSPEAEVWLLLLKNGLHGSKTPARKINGVNAPIHSEKWSPNRSGFINILYRAVERKVWEFAAGAGVDKLLVLRGRIYFVILRIASAPLSSASGFTGWFVSRVVGLLR